MRKLLLCLLSYATTILSTPQPQHFNIEGWHLTNPGTQPDKWFGNDPVVGRLTCPPLTRLNLKVKRAQNLIVSSIETPSTHKWIYNIRSGIYWWNGQQVSPSDLDIFLKDQLPSSPTFTTKIIDQAVEVHWQSQPNFGPYILNGLPFHKTDTEHPAGFQCAGNYQPATQNWDVLVPNTGYNVKRPTLNFQKKHSQPDISFKYAQDKLLNPNNFHQTSFCKLPVPINASTVIRWSPNSSIVYDKQVKNLLSHAIPRHTLARVGASTLADATQSFIPKIHPVKSPKAQTLSLQKIADELDKLGYKRTHPDHLRQTPKGDPMVLSASTPHHNILSKVLMDNFHALGIDIHFDSRKRDLEIESHWFSWPELDLNVSPHHQLTPKVKTLIKTYQRSLSDYRPQFELLKPIDTALQAQADVTMVMHHQACLELQQSFNYGGGQLEILDPDWFRDMIELAYRKG